MIGWWVRMIAAAAMVLLAAGCTGGDGDPPSSLPDITPSSAAPQSQPTSTPEEPEPTPTGETPPEPRDGMHEYSQAGVDAFTRYVIDVINYSSRTNDVALLEAISTEDCQFCAGVIERATAIGEAGGRIEGGELVPSAERFDLIGPAEDFETSAGVQLVLTASQTIDGDGNVRNTEDDRDRYIIFAYSREDDQWKLAEARTALPQPS